MAVTADFMRLELLRTRIESIGSAGGLRPVLAALTAEAHQQTLNCFIEERDPYGRRWAARKKAPDWAIRAFGLMQSNHKLLDKTGDGIDSLTAKPTATGIRLRIAGHMRFHLTGTGKMKARKFFPVDGLGPIWGDAFLRVSSKVFRGLLRAA